MAEYNQDRFELEIHAKEVQSPERVAKTKVFVRMLKMLNEIDEIINQCCFIVYFSCGYLSPNNSFVSYCPDHHRKCVRNAMKLSLS